MYPGGFVDFPEYPNTTWSTHLSPSSDTAVNNTVAVEGTGLFTGVAGTGSGWHGNGYVGRTCVTDVVEFATLDTVVDTPPFVVEPDVDDGDACL